MPLLLTESKQSIINLGFPDIIASIIQQKFGKYAYIVANWYKQYYAGEHSYTKDLKDWFEHSIVSYKRDTISLSDSIKLYNSTFKGSNEYIKELNRLEITNSYEYYTPEMLHEERKEILIEIEERLFKNQVFFSSYNLIKDLKDKKLVNFNKYKHLKVHDAILKYDENRIFGEKVPLKTYSNGFKWIDVGRRSEVVGKYMKNCGSVGVMSLDKDKTMLALFNSDNKPHVIVTLSPNEKRISGVEGIACTVVKDEYIDYVIDLENIIDAKIDLIRIKSVLLKIKTILKNKLKSIKRIKANTFNEYFVFQLISGDIYFTDGEMVISYVDVKKATQRRNSVDFKPTNVNVHGIQSMFNHLNIQDYQNNGIKYIPLIDFKENE